MKNIIRFGLKRLLLCSKRQQWRQRSKPLDDISNCKQFNSATYFKVQNPIRLFV